jgi:hypothetical protein
MKLKSFTIALMLLAAGRVSAQDVLKGSVHESGSDTKLTNVFIRDMNNSQLTLADKNGNFEIKTETGHTLIFNSPGYMTDTMYVVDMTPKKIRMAPLTIALREVSINSSRNAAFDPHTEFPEVYQKSKVYLLSPSSWVGKDARDARRLKRYFEMEEQQRRIDEVFNTTYVGSIVPLKGQELEDFMVMYRPSYAFITNNNTGSLAAYINDSYKKYMALPPDKRKLEKLTSE